MYLLEYPHVDVGGGIFGVGVSINGRSEHLGHYKEWLEY